MIPPPSLNARAHQAKKDNAEDSSCIELPSSYASISGCQHASRLRQEMEKGEGAFNRNFAQRHVQRFESCWSGRSPSESLPGTRRAELLKSPVAAPGLRNPQKLALPLQAKLKQLLVPLRPRSPRCR